MTAHSMARRYSAVTTIAATCFAAAALLPLVAASERVLSEADPAYYEPTEYGAEDPAYYADYGPVAVFPDSLGPAAIAPEPAALPLPAAIAPGMPPLPDPIAPGIVPATDPGIPAPLPPTAPGPEALPAPGIAEQGTGTAETTGDAVPPEGSGSDRISVISLLVSAFGTAAAAIAAFL